ncbi:MAG: GWxTD domain-containing protein [Candidatus Aminicenantes bacterium]|nr:MAG: GWxTD domain-containing protein [Candidatus Aminicenantes bacterium]
MRKISILTITITMALTFTLISGGAYGVEKIKDEPSRPGDKFFDETRLIMLKDEIRIYKHLADNEARESFIEDFWKKRDPTPGTEENENRMEFERRVEYVERWFKERVGKGRGWDSDRGKVYLLLGDPDERTTQQKTILDRFNQPKRVLAETWIYNYHRLYLEFIDADGLGRYRLRNWTVELLGAIERAKFTIHPTEKAKQEFKFKAACKNKEIKIRIPIKLITFNENEKAGSMSAGFKITLFIYHNYKKIHQLEETRNISGTHEELLNRKNIELTIPIPLSSKGKYLFDIIVEEVESGSKYRDMIKYKL